MAVHARRVVASRKLCAPRRGGGIVLAAGTSGQIEFAGLRRLHQGKTKVPIGGGNLLSLRRHGRDSAIGRIDNRRRALAGALHGPKYVVVSAGDVELAPTRATLVAAAHLRPCSVEFRPLSLREEFLVRKPGGALQGRVVLDRPNPMQIGFAPRRL